MSLMSTVPLLFALSTYASLKHAQPEDDGISTLTSNWAVLVAGSNSYFNYRHQADVAHAYHILTTKGGFPKEHVIVMMYDDIASSSENPFPGQLFNEPGGDDVYKGIEIAYSGEEVTAENFLNVIRGIKDGDTANGPVLESGKRDRVFIYYSDHGAPGLVGMPVGDPLYATDLNKALQSMHTQHMYSQLVFYLESCESGSMFDHLLPTNISVFATTAAAPDQPSYAYYYNDTLSTYMADEYSIRWMQDTANHWNDDGGESIEKQFEDVAKIVQESQPQKYGDESFDVEPVEDFEAYKYKQKVRSEMNYDAEWIPSRESVSVRDVNLAVLQHRYLAEKEPNKKELAAKLVQQEIEYRQNVDVLFEVLVERILGYSDKVVTYGHIAPSNFDCLKRAYSVYEAFCERFTAYSLQYVRVLVNLCEITNDIDTLEYAMVDLCQ